MKTACLALLFACAASTALAVDIQAYTEELPPLNYQQDGQVQGYASEVLMLMAKEAGLSLNMQLLPWARAFEVVQHTPGALLFSTVRTPEREALFLWVGPISARRIYMYRLSSRQDIRLERLEDLRRYRNGAMAGSRAAQQLRELGLQAGGRGLDITRDDETDLKKLLRGRVDLVAMLDWSMAWQLSQQGLLANMVTPAYLLDDKNQYWFALNLRTAPDVAQKLQQALDRLSASGQLKKIQHRYLDD